VTRPLTLSLARFGWQIVLGALAFLQVVAMFSALADPLYVAKWVGGVALLVCFLALGHWRISTEFLREFGAVIAILGIGFIAQLADALDSRAVAIAVTYALTAAGAFLIAPCTFRRRSIQRLVWPAMLWGVAIATLLGEYLGSRDVLRSFSITEGRWRFWGGFNLPNSAGTAGLIGVILAVAAFHSTRRRRYLVFVVPFTVVMLLADSRGSVLAALAFLGTIALVRVSRWRTEQIALAVCTAVAAVLGLGLLNSSSLAWPDLSHAQMNLNLYSTGRWDTWQQALDYLETPLQWIFGLGLSRNLSFVGRWTYLPVPIRGSNADNFFVDLLGRTGIVGVALFLVMMAWLAVRLCAGLRRTPARAASDRAQGIAVLTATFVLGLTNSVIFTWGWLHAMVAWPLVTEAAIRATSPAPTSAPPRR
jgi:O-antigen ligase